jgi:hypothetical protein
VLASRGLWRVIDLLFRKNLHMLHVHPVFTTHGKTLQPLVFVDV